MAGKKTTGKARGAQKNQKNASTRKDIDAKMENLANGQDLPEAAINPGDLPATEKPVKDLPAVEKDPGDLPATEKQPKDLPAVEKDPGDLPATEKQPEAARQHEDKLAQGVAPETSAKKDKPQKASAKAAGEKMAAPKDAPKKEAPAQNAASPIPPVGKITPRMPAGLEKRPVYSGNPYLPKMARVVEVIQETANINTLRLVLEDEEAMQNFVFEPGQVGQLSVFGVGEATFVINSPPSQKSWLQFSVMRAGEVTDALHRVDAGDQIGLRAPLGNFFPYQDWRGKNVFFIGGGIGMAPIRTIMLHLLEHKADYGKISLLYGARSPKDMAYSYELDDWRNNPDLDCTLCIDNPYENWEHKVGLIPKVLEELNPAPDNTVAVICGPPVMIKFTLQSLQKLGFDPQNIVTTLEKRMKCGIGICGRCNIGDRYVCVDGPVFTLAELNTLPADL